MLRPTAALCGVMLVSASSAAPAQQTVEIGGMQWYQPNGATFYRSLGEHPAPELRPRKIPISVAKRHDDDDLLRQAAHLLRSAAVLLDQSKKDGNPADVRDAEATIQQALGLLSHNK